VLFIHKTAVVIIHLSVNLSDISVISLTCLIYCWLHVLGWSGIMKETQLAEFDTTPDASSQQKEPDAWYSITAFDFV